MESNIHLDFDHYTIAWIAPLEIEAQAAMYMLDHEHQGNFRINRGDDYVYTAGDINGHNVIIATFPAGHDYGVGSAAALASQVKKSFHNLWFGLLVGVAAGLPKLPGIPGEPVIHPRDIRLGDVLVGVGDGESAGLLSYGLGKETSDGFVLLHHGTQAKTQTVVRSAIGNIKARTPKHGNEFLRHYESIKKQKHHNGTFEDPGQESDELYLTVDEQLVDKQSVDKQSVDKQNGLKDILVKREVRPAPERTKVWYGTIGSGDTLMKNAKKRNELRDKFNLIGLEMEAAGTMDTIPVGMIRGVCDYGDSRKNKEWQPYAAAMAAAYAKEVLYKITPEKNRREEVLQLQAALRMMKPTEAQNAHKPAAPTTLPSTGPGIDYRPLSRPPYLRDPKFVSHDNILERIEQKFANHRRVALYGSSGNGKTRIAIEYAHKYVEKYPRAKVLWVNARTAEQLEYAYKTIGTELSIQGIKDPKKNILDVVNLYLSQGNHGQWLMVLDGADDEDTFLKKRATSSKQDSSGKQKQKTLLDYVPKCRSGSVLITSRSFSLACEMVNKQGDDTLEIPTFTTEESISLLRKTLSEDVCDNKGACTLVEVLHRSPMAISQATAYILARGKEITIPDYLASLKSRTLQASDENGNAVKANELYSAESAAVGACQILYDFIRQKYPEAGRLLAVISILDLQSIPAFLLDKNADDTKLVETAISILDQFGMITSFADQTFVGTIRLVQLSTKSWLAQKGEKTWASERALWLLTSAFPSADYEDLYEMCDILYPYANLVLGLQPTSRMSRLDRATLLFNTAGYAKYLGKYDDARRSLEEAVKLREEELGKDDEQVQDTKKALEAVSEAKRQTEMGIQPAKEGASAGSGKQWSIWSSAIGRTSKWPKALTKVQNLLQLAQQSLDQEQHHEAEARSKEGLAECEKTLGQDHIDTLKMADCLAIAYQSQGRQDEALAAHIRVLEWCKTKYGLDHIDTLRQTYNLALTYDLQGQYDKATTMYLEALEGTKKLLGPDNPEALRIMCSLATVYDLQGHTTEAESTFREALAGQQARLGDSHPETLLTMHNLALCAQSHNDLATSEQYLLRALEGQDLVLGPEHSATLRTASNLALNFQLMHKYEQAEPLFLLALEGQAKRLGEEHPDTLFTRHMLGEFYEELGRTGEAEVQYRLALEGRERRLGQQHHDTLLTKRRLEALGGRLDVAKAPINDVVQLH